MIVFRRIGFKRNQVPVHNQPWGRTTAEAARRDPRAGGSAVKPGREPVRMFDWHGSGQSTSKWRQRSPCLDNLDMDGKMTHGQ